MQLTSHMGIGHDPSRIAASAAALPNRGHKHCCGSRGIVNDELHSSKWWCNSRPRLLDTVANQRWPN